MITALHLGPWVLAINLDELAGLLCGWMAICIFGLHVMSSRSRKRWMDVPQYVRWGLAFTGTAFMVRSVNFFTNGSPDFGHINFEGLGATLTLAYTVTALTAWWGLRFMPGLGWDRVAWVTTILRRHPGRAPVMMTLPEVVETANALGVPAVDGQAPPAEVLRVAGAANRWKL